MCKIHILTDLVDTLASPPKDKNKLINLQIHNRMTTERIWTKNYSDKTFDKYFQ